MTLVTQATVAPTLAMRAAMAATPITSAREDCGMVGLALLVGAFVAFGVFVVLAYRRRWQWTGLPAAPAASTGAEVRAAKTLWDWLQLLGIPVALASLAFLLNEAQSRRDQTHEDQRAARQRTAAVDADRENTLRTYLAQMSDLMLDRGLLGSKQGADVREVARTATLTAVRRLDGPRRGLIVRFLAEARLLRRANHRSARVIVASADLAHAVLIGARLAGANLGKANLSGANLRAADLSGANLYGADLRGADLRRANVRGADLITVDLRGANLSGAHISRSILLGADLRGANVSRAGLSLTNLSGANLSGTDFSGANLSGTDLRYAVLSGTVLSGANLSAARGVDLTGTFGKPTYRP